MIIHENLTFLGLTSNPFSFIDKTTGKLIEGDTHKIKFMDMSDSEIYVFKYKEEDTEELKKLVQLTNYLVNLKIMAIKEVNQIFFESVEKNVEFKK